MFAATTVTISPILLWSVLIAIGCAVMFVGAHKEDNRLPKGGLFMILGTALWLPSLIMLVVTSEDQRTTKMLAQKHLNLPEPWFDLYEQLWESRSPQLKEVVLRRSLEGFDCSGTLPPAGFDLFMSATEGEASKLLEPCLQIPEDKP